MATKKDLLAKLSTLVPADHPTRDEYLAECEKLTNPKLEEVIAKLEADAADQSGANPQGEGRTNEEAEAAADADGSKEKSAEPLKEAPAAVQSEPDLMYKGKTVHSYQNKIAHGHRYIEVNVGTAIYTISPEEFENEVKPRA